MFAVAAKLNCSLRDEHVQSVQLQALPKSRRSPRHMCSRPNLFAKPWLGVERTGDYGPHDSPQALRQLLVSVELSPILLGQSQTT